MIHQLSSQLKIVHEQQRDFHLIDWKNAVDKSWQSFASEIKQASEREKPTVLVITSQSLKRRLPEFFTQTEKEYKNLQNSFLGQLGGLYIDEAHHLGAYRTKLAILKLLEDSRRYQRAQGEGSETFLYGTTATPVHPEVDLREFFEREHWAYLNAGGNLFEKHNVESVLEQLAIGIDKGELTPFDDLYVIGEKSFEDLATEDQSSQLDQSENIQQELSQIPIFIQVEESTSYVLNPNYYEPLLRIIGPILESNQKGFIVTATIAEAERLEEFLNQATTGIEFEAYHSKMEDLDRRDVLNRSKSSKSSHYIIAVKALDEGVDLPHLSAYIDLNLNVSIKQMIHRIGRVLRLSPGKQTADILFLINYRNEQLAKDALNILEQLEILSFSGENKRQESGDSHLKFEDAGISPLSRAELQEMRNRLPEYIQKFWDEKYTLAEIPGAVAKLNETSPIEEQIQSERAFEEFRYKDPRFPSWDSIKRQYKEKHGSYQGLSDFVLSESNFIQLYTLDEVPQAVAKLNATSPAEKQIKSVKTYKKFYHKDERLPPWHTLGVWFQQKYGNKKGLLNFVLNKGRPYTLKDIPVAVARLNAISPAEKQITGVNTYKKFHHKDPRLPTFNTVLHWYKKEYGSSTGVMAFILTGKRPEPKPNTEFYTLKEIPGAIARLNATSPIEEQITNKTTYEKFRHKDQKLPSWSAASEWFAKKHDNRQGFSNFMFGRSCEDTITR